MSDPVVLPVTLNEQLSKAVSSAISIDEIRAAVVSEAEKQAAEKQVTDAATADAAKKKTEDDAAAVAAQGFKRTVTIGGREFEFEAATELELERSINNALTVAFAVQPAPATAAKEPETVVAGPTEEEKAAARADLELKFKRGEIDTATYLEQSGAVDDYLSKKGVSIDALKTTVERSQSAAFEQSWASATEEFLKSPAGSTWPGGEQNKKLIGMQIAALGLVDSDDKVAALAQAYKAMQDQGIVFPATTVETKTAVVDASKAASVAAASPTPATLTAAAAAPAAKKEVTSSSLFGASSGVGATVLTGKETAETKFDIPANATPAEILDAWKKAQVAAGKDPNAAFSETFSSRK